MSERLDERTYLLMKIEQLRQQCAIKREKVSETVQDLIDFMDETEKHDHFLRPVRDSKNPFAEKAKCDLL
ncbi:guanine nucleotide-binding protein subunit gamma-like [Convolutriloba macropyga]|uniref:guanine nucleotide-binding protein subunit gamma-like n=1 Tax=Convolutriloba macropyga TaxID=536237 RepID=UPI003F5276B0